MMPLTFDRILASAEALSPDEQAMLEELLHRRRIDNWRNETATEAAAAVNAFRSGKLKPASVEIIISRLRKSK